MDAFRRAIGIIFLLGGVALFGNATMQTVNGAPVFVNDGFDGPYIIRLFGPGLATLIGGLFLSTRKASRAHVVTHRVETSALQYAVSPAHSAPVAPPVETVTQVWDACSRCRDVNVSNVESISMCACGNRESMSGEVDTWPDCPRCGQMRVTKTHSGRCAGCGAIRRRG